MTAQLKTALDRLEAERLAAGRGRGPGLPRTRPKSTSLKREREQLLARIAALEEETRAHRRHHRRGRRPPRRRHRGNPHRAGGIAVHPQGESLMPLVNVMVNSRAYTIACDDGEEDHLRELANHVDDKVRELLELGGPGRRSAAAADGGAAHRRRASRGATQLDLRTQELGDLSRYAGEHDRAACQKSETNAAELARSGRQRGSRIIAASACARLELEADGYCPARQV